MESSIRPQGVRRCASRFVVSGEHSKAPPTTRLARPKTLATMPVSGCLRLKLASSSLITPPTWRTDLGDHRYHLLHVMGERAGHIERWPSHLRDSSDIISPSASGSAPIAFRRTAGADVCLVGGGVAPGQSPSQLTTLGVTYKKTGWYHVNYRAGSSQSR